MLPFNNDIIFIYEMIQFEGLTTLFKQKIFFFLNLDKKMSSINMIISSVSPFLYQQNNSTSTI